VKPIFNTRKNFIKNPWFIFLPFLAIYVILVITFPTQLRIGDEIRYCWYADNLTHGFYSPPQPDIILWNGPGYPITLVPIIALQLPDVCLTILNALFMYVSVVLLFIALKKYVSFKVALIFTIFWATYIDMFASIIFVLSESLTALIITLLLYYIVKTFESSSKKHLFISGLLLGYLVLTKIIFAYVILVLLAGLILLWMLNLKNLNYRKGTVIILIAFATTSPYLIYTYQLTGRFFYWGNSGGQQIYWMSTPFPEEYGDWMSPLLNFKNDFNGRFASNDSLLKVRHQKDMNEIDNLKYKYLFDGTSQDDAFKRFAIRNIKQHPAKYFLNCIANTGRMVFGFPFSYKKESPLTLITMPWKTVLLTFILLCLIPTILNWRKLIFSLRFILIFTLIYLFGSTLVSAYPRMFDVIVPVLLFWIALIMSKSLTIKTRFVNN